MTTARVLGRDFPIAPTVEYQIQYHKVGVKIRGRSAAVQLRIETDAPSKTLRSPDRTSQINSWTSIRIANKKFVLSLYDKRDAFPFDVVSFPHTTSNIHFRRAHGVFVAQLVRDSQGCMLAIFDNEFEIWQANW